jgi:SAM-dependent methyltransferase
MACDSGWTDDLTDFHEETAGANHPIDVASRVHAARQLKNIVVEAPVVLEIGCSSGFMLREIRRSLPRAFVIGSDYVRGPLEKVLADMPDLPVLQFDLIRCPMPDESLDALVLLNVLEHIRDDAGAVQQLYRTLKPGGVAVIEVPAGPNLFDVYDKMLMHFRRYSLRSITTLLQSAGFEIVKKSHLGFFVYPAFWVIKQRNKRFLSQDEAAQKRVVAGNIRSTQGSWLFHAVMGVELFLGRFVSYPRGIRCLLTCRKPIHGKSGV